MCSSQNVFCTGPREAALTEASKQLVPLFEELVTTIVERNTESPGSSPRGKLEPTASFLPFMNDLCS